jgi:hypothetical protein
MTTARVSYVLLTQCLQNDLFLNRDCRLFLPDHVAQSMLLSKRDYAYDQGTGSRRTIPRKVLERGPLGLLLDRVARRGSESGDELLHLVNIRDWHDHDDAYDAERRVYGPHCEAGSWGAQYIDGLEHYLDPGGNGDEIGAPPYEKGRLRVHHVHSDSLFDFKPRAEQIGSGTGRFSPSILEGILDEIVDSA